MMKSERCALTIEIYVACYPGSIMYNLYVSWNVFEFGVDPSSSAALHAACITVNSYLPYRNFYCGVKKLQSIFTRHFWLPFSRHSHSDQQQLHQYHHRHLHHPSHLFRTCSQRYQQKSRRVISSETAVLPSDLKFWESDDHRSILAICNFPKFA